jgi:activating signal cointegrator complex subunit 1
MASTTTMPASSTPDQRQNEHPLQTKKQKKPALTHFLCLPLVSETSLPLLENALTKFKRNIPSRCKTLDDHPAKPRPRLFPDSAVRPLGTLHLTLGVMSLPTPERIEEAVGLLQSLDVGRILQEVESELANSNNNKDNHEQKEDKITTQNQYPPISVSLEALHSLPRAKTATVLYAHPVDPTSRLHPFAVKVRNEFVNAGFIEQDFVKPRLRKHKGKKGKPLRKLPGDDGNNNENEIENAKANGKIMAAESEEERLLQQKPKFRPLLLHATLVNTIYARRRPNPHQSSGVRKGRKFNGPLTFDARDILAHYRDFYTDDTCTQEKQPPADDIIEYGTSLNSAHDDTSGQSDDDGDSASLSSEEEAHPSKAVIHQISPHGNDEHASLQPKYPFIWARNVPIEKLCICEMGAKKPNEDSGPSAARLGQEYRVVAEKKLFE